MDRQKFLLPGKHYFLSHSVGAQPKSYADAVAEGYADPWAMEGLNVWGPWFQALDRFRAGLAPLIGAHADDICMQSNVSSAISKILFSLPERTGRKKIVLTEDDFPTVGFALGQACRMGYELVFLPGGARLADPDAWAPAFHDDVQLVLATQVFSNSSVMTPVAEISRRARQSGVFSILDIAQAAGGVPVNLNDWTPDFAVGTSLKYLCGGTGAAFLWAARETAKQCSPLDVGWFSHENPFEFDIRRFEYTEGAARFLGGTPSIAPFAGAAAGQRILMTHGVEKIFTHNQSLLSRLTGALPDGALLSSTVEGARGNGALIKVRDYDQAAAALSKAGVFHDTRLDAVRVSVHLYNDEADIDALIKAITPHI